MLTGSDMVARNRTIHRCAEAFHVIHASGGGNEHAVQMAEERNLRRRLGREYFAVKSEYSAPCSVP